MSFFFSRTNNFSQQGPWLSDPLNPAFTVYFFGFPDPFSAEYICFLPFIYDVMLVVHFIHRCDWIQAFTFFFFFSVRTLRLICACAEDYSCLNEVESTPRAAAMWVNQLHKVSTLCFSYHWECSEKLHFSSPTFYWRENSFSLSSPVTQTRFCRRGSVDAVWSGFISPPLTLTQQGLPWVGCPPDERLFPVRWKSGSSCLGLGLTQVLEQGVWGRVQKSWIF